MTMINSSDIVEVHEAVIAIRKLIIIKTLPYQVLIDSGCVQRLLQLASQENYLHLTLESLWCLANIASGQNKETALMVNKGII